MHQIKQKLTLYFSCILFKKNNQMNEETNLLHNTTVRLQNNCCGFECTNSNLGN